MCHGNDIDFYYSTINNDLEGVGPVVSYQIRYCNFFSYSISLRLTWVAYSRFGLVALSPLL